jgi:MFS transporter, ACS family, glucarate transporter
VAEHGTQSGEHPAQAAKPTRYRWFVLAMIFLTYMVAGADRANLGVAIPYIKADFHLSNTDIGATASLFYIGYALLQIPSGLIYQRFGVRYVMMGAMLLTSAATWVIGLSASVFHLKVARAILGVAEAPLNVGILTTINRWFPAHEKGTAVGVFMSSIKFAPAIVPPLGALIIYALGWRYIFFLFAFPGIVIALLWFLFVKDNPRASKFVNAAEADYIDGTGAAAAEAKRDTIRPANPLIDRLIRARQVKPLSTNAEIFTSSQIWCCALSYGLLAGLTYTIMTWIPTYLVEAKGYAIMEMGLVAATPWIGAMIGNLLGGYLSDRVFAQRRKPVMLITAASTILTMYWLTVAPQNPLALSGVFLIVGILLNLGYSTHLAYAMGLVEQERYPVAAAVTNTVGAVISAASPFIVGVILDNFDWSAMFIFMSSCAFLALLCVVYLIEPLPRRN